MKSPASILAATDLSASSRHAVARAFLLAAETGAALTLTHVVSQGALDTLLRLFGAESVPVEKLLMEEAREALAKLEEEFGESRSVSASLKLQAGVVLNEIIEQADAVDARGESPLRPLLLGSTAGRLQTCAGAGGFFAVVLVGAQAGQGAGTAGRAGLAACV